ncbi:hypothetical protein GW17_00009332, partial [Ensete ventricosum]
SKDKKLAFFSLFLCLSPPLPPKHDQLLRSFAQGSSSSSSFSFSSLILFVIPFRSPFLLLLFPSSDSAGTHLIWSIVSQSLSKIACNRLQKELAEWQVNPPAGFKHKATDNLQRLLLGPCSPLWVIEVAGAPGTLYANETYQLQVDFPEHYPMEAPQVMDS